MFCNTLSNAFVPPASYEPVQSNHVERVLGATAEVELGAEADGRRAAGCMCEIKKINSFTLAY
jgi:hypothetical protein